MTNCSRVLCALRDELLAVLRDPAALLMLGGATLVYGLIYPLPYARQLARDIPIGVVDADDSALSRRLTRMLDAAEQLEVVHVARSMPAAERLVRASSIRGVVTIGSNFERSVQRGEPAVVGVHADASSFMVYTQVATGAAQAAGTLSAGIEIRRLQAAGADQRLAGELREPVRLRTQAVFNPAGGYGSAVVPGVFILLLQQTLLVGIGTLAGGRRERGFAAAEPYGATLLGRGGAYVLLYSLHALACYHVLYRVHGLTLRGSTATALLFLLPFIIATAFLGIAVSSAFRERETALPVLVTTSLPAIFVSGFPWPAEAMPAWLRALARLLPSTTGIDGAIRITQLGATLRDVWPQWLELWLLGALYFGAALLTSRAAAGTDGGTRCTFAGAGPYLQDRRHTEV